MASSSTPTSPGNNNNYVFDVFINHRGPDVKRTLATDLHNRLCKHDLRVFLDQQELQEGEKITPQIESAIRTASVHIAIFSPRYADSRWCLDELLLMVETMSKSSSTIIPVFYGVNPAELRWTRSKNGVYARALCVLEEKKTSHNLPRYDNNTIEKWRKALSEVADIKGFDGENYNGVKTGVLQCLEAVFKLCNFPSVFRPNELLEDVVEAVLKNVKRTLDVSEYPAGLAEKLKDLETTVSLQQECGKARVIGIVGLGGVGKTTLAKKFFNHHRSNYKRSCFLFDVREKSSLNFMQSILLKELAQFHGQIRSPDEGKVKIRRYLQSCQALVIVDDVDHVKQLDALLLPAKDVLHPRSLILVTSRDKRVLINADITESSIYTLKGLNRQHSRQLFCSHAFGQPHPVVGFDEVVQKFLDSCQGLPLSLKVLGAHMRGINSLTPWKAQLHKISKILPEDIQSRLKISYDGLDEEEKKIFLDIACFFVGEDMDTVVRIWDGSDGEGGLNVGNLQNKCLVEVDEKNRIRMHDHLRELGRHLANKDGEIRLWGPPDSVLDNLSGQLPVRGIRMVHGNHTEQSFENLMELAGSRLSSNMRRLQLLRADGCFVERLFRVGQLTQLIYLRWENFPISSLPSTIPIKNLRVLHIEGENLETLWQHESEAPLQLRELHIGAPLSYVPESIGNLKHLEKFVLYKSNLEALPNEFCHMHSLKLLELKECENMTVLPNSIGNLTGLQSLDLCGCSSLQRLPDSVGNLTGLQSLVLARCSALQTLPGSVGNLTGLQNLDLAVCSALQRLPDSIGNLTSLHSLGLASCSSLQTLPDSVGNLTGLQRLDSAWCPSLQILPDSIGNLTGLQRLDVGGCPTLQTLPDSVGNLTGLQILYLGGCSTLQTLPDSVGNLTGLRDLDLGGCSALQTLSDSIGNLTGLQHLKLGGCFALQKLPDSVGNLTCLRRLQLSGCSALQTLPDTVGNLTGLRRLQLSGCSALQTLPDTVGNLTGLRQLRLGGCSALQTLPNSVGNLKDLKSLQLSLQLSGCSALQTLPHSVGNLKDLQSLPLSGCSSLRKLPDTVGDLTALQKLHLGECSALPDSGGSE
eukprot:PITA_14484